MKSISNSSSSHENLQREHNRTTEAYFPALIAMISLAFGAYYVLRYLGNWSGQDTAQFVNFIDGMQRTGQLSYSGAYSHGYAYSVWVTALSELSGVKIQALTTLYLPLCGNFFLGMFGFVAFRRLLESARLGLLAASTLFLIPEIVLVVSRGNHEKLTVALTLIAILALLNSFLEMSPAKRWPVFAGWVLTFYLTAFCLVSLNVFFGSTLIVSSTLTLVFTALFIRLRPTSESRFRPVVSRLILVVAASWLFVSLVLWYIYPAASGVLNVISSGLERFGILTLSATPEGASETVTTTNPYSVVQTAWVNSMLYIIISSFRWITFVISFGVWLYLLVRVFQKPEDTSLSRLFLLALYGAFGLQLAVAIPIDFLGTRGGSNLQVRLYTYFALLAVPLFTLGIQRLLLFAAVRGLRKVFVGLLISPLIAIFLVFSLLKTPLDPVVSNNWLFYRNDEIQAVRFWVDHVGPYASLWSSPSGRLRYGYTNLKPEHAPSGSRIAIGFPSNLYGYALSSEVIGEEAVALQVNSPPHWLEHRLYDNGGVRTYALRPRTPFQSMGQ